jgi:deoxyribonuclease-4
MPEPQHAVEAAFDPADEYRPEPEPEPVPPAWMDGSVRIGIHTSIAGDVAQSLDIAKKLGCNAVQIFSASPRMWPRAAARIADADAQRFRARRLELALGPVVIHGNYLVNLAATQPMLRARSVQAFHDEITRALALGADFLVVHPGARGEARFDEAADAVAQGIRQAARGVQIGNLHILIENTSGMGTALGWRFEEVAAILERLSDVPAGVCLDTAHTFAAGYDIRSVEGLERTLHQIDDTIGLGHVFVVHVNDSKTPLGSRVDRHEHIGKGKIGLEAFRRILNHPRLSANGAQGLPGRAFILETPIDRPGDDRKNVKTVWALAGFVAKQAPKAEDGFSMLRKRRSMPARGRKPRGKAGAPKRRRAGKSARRG